MKQIFKTFLLAGAVSFSLSSCLKDEMVIDPDKTENVIEFANTSAIASPATSSSQIAAFVNTFDIAPQNDFNITVQYAGAHTAPEDITVQLAIDPTLITEYNTANSKTYIELPANLYTISTLKVTIPKGGKSVVIPVKLKSSEFDFTKAYALPLRIQSASSGNISANFGRALFTVGAKNAYHGTYKHTYTSTLGNGTNTVKLETVDANTVKFNPGLIGVYSNYQALQIDPATKKVTVIMTTLLPVATDPVSNYNPATKTFYLKWTSNGGARTFEETLVLQP